MHVYLFACLPTVAESKVSQSFIYYAVITIIMCMPKNPLVMLYLLSRHTRPRHH